MVTKLHLEQTYIETAALKAQLEEQTKLENEFKPLTDALKNEV